jgi:hypothetical protein
MQVTFAKFYDDLKNDATEENTQPVASTPVVNEVTNQPVSQEGKAQQSSV